MDWIAFFRLAGRLKTLHRQGWLDRGVPEPESVADHSYRLALMAWMLGSAAGLDTAHLLKLVLVHDLPEALAGDATPYAQLIARGLDAEEAVSRWRELLAFEDLAEGQRRKRRSEEAALDELLADVDPVTAEEIRTLWIEYAERRTPEARFVVQIDKLEALLQALEYREQGHPADVESFLQSARDQVEHPVLKELLVSLAVAADRQGA